MASIYGFHIKEGAFICLNDQWIGDISEYSSGKIRIRELYDSKKINSEIKARGKYSDLEELIEAYKQLEDDEKILSMSKENRKYGIIIHDGYVTKLTETSTNASDEALKNHFNCPTARIYRSGDDFTIGDEIDISKIEIDIKVS